MHIDEIKNINVHWFKSAVAPKDQPVVPDGIGKLHLMIESQKLKDRVIELRSMPTTTDDERREQTRTKARFPNFGLTTFKDYRSNDTIAEPVRIIIVDIDKKNNGSLSLDDLFSKLSEVPHVAGVSTSIRGEGVYAIIPIQPTTDIEAFKHIFESLRYDFGKIGIQIDKSCSDFQRVRFFGYSDRVFWREGDVEVYLPHFKIPSVKEPKNALKSGCANADASCSRPQPSFSQFRPLSDLVKEVHKRKIDIAPEYDDYLSLCFALVDSMGEEGRQMFHDLCQFSPKYNEREADNKYSNVLKSSKGEHTLLTVFGLIRRAGVIVDRPANITVTVEGDEPNESIAGQKDAIISDIKIVLFDYPSTWDEALEYTPDDLKWRFISWLTNLEAAVIARNHALANAILDEINKAGYSESISDELQNQYAPTVAKLINQNN